MLIKWICSQKFQHRCEGQAPRKTVSITPPSNTSILPLPRSYRIFPLWDVTLSSDPGLLSTLRDVKAIGKEGAVSPRRQTDNESQGYRRVKAGPKKAEVREKREWWKFAAWHSPLEEVKVFKIFQRTKPDGFSATHCIFLKLRNIFCFVINKQVSNATVLQATTSTFVFL